MFFLPLGIDGATSSLKAPLVVLQDRTGICLIQTKKTTQITGAIVNLLGSYLGVSENSVPLNPMVNDHYPY